MPLSSNIHEQFANNPIKTLTGPSADINSISAIIEGGSIGSRTNHKFHTDSVLFIPKLDHPI
jgi:hypothetical protein